MGKCSRHGRLLALSLFVLGFWCFLGPTARANSQADIHCNLTWDWIRLRNFEPNSVVTVELYDDSGELLTDPIELPTSEDGAAEVRGVVDLVPGHKIVAARGSTYEKELVLAFVTVDGVDLENNLIQGAAPANAPIRVETNVTAGPYQREDDIFADSNGRWLLDLDGQLDLAHSTGASVKYFDADGDATESNLITPFIWASLTGNIHIQDWMLFEGYYETADGHQGGGRVTYEIRDEQDNLLYQAENSEDFLTGIWIHGVDLLPGYRILALKTLTGEVKELELIYLTVDLVDPQADTISGTAPPGAQVEVSAYTDCPWCGWGTHYGFQVTADAQGFWTADFGRRAFDITADMAANAKVYDEDGDATLAEPIFKTATIDIKPGSYPNSLNLGSRGVVPVAILTTSAVEATGIDPVSVVFAGASPLRWHLEDADGNGSQDLILHFDIRELALDQDSAQAWLTALTFDGQHIQGVDSVRIVPG